MNTIKKLGLAVIGILFAFSFANAQNYKAPKIDAEGKIANVEGVHVGTVGKEGVLDPKGSKLAHIDTDGSLIDSKTGKKIGKAEKNGNFIYVSKDSPDGQKFTVSVPENGICDVKDASGKTVMQIHENYKAQAGCAYHCSQMAKAAK
ncbi:MAG: hypothetical protein K2Q22_10895 [Cytophagales bacterium]|nr:hypothetical protein [Cytophagales bacterium]